MAEDFEEIYWGKKLDDLKNQKHTKVFLIKHKIQAYLVASRSPTILITTAFFLLGEWSAVQDIPFYQTIPVIIFLILAEFVNGLTNFFSDKKLDIFARKHTVWVFKYISSKEMLITTTICSFLALLIVWYFYNLTTFLVGAILIVITIFYAFPPIRFKTKAPLDVISNMFILGSLPFLLGWLVTDTKLSFNSILLGLIMGIPVISYNLIISWDDIKTDKEFGIKTTIVLLGENWAIHVSIFLWIVLIFSSFFAFDFDISTLSFIIVFPVLFILWIRHIKLKDFKRLKRNAVFFLWVATTLWLCFLFLSLAILTKSSIPMIFFVIELLSFFIFLRRSISFINY